MGLERTGLSGELVATAYNLVRMSNLIVEREAEVPVLGASVPWARCALQTPVRALRAATETNLWPETADMKEPMRPVIPLRRPQSRSSAAC